MSLPHNGENLSPGGGTEAALEETIAFWQPIAGRELSREDARQIRENLTGFFRVLMEWDAADAGRGAPKRAA